MPARGLLLAAALVLLPAFVGCGSDGEGSTVDQAAELGRAEADRAAQITSNIDASDVVKVLPPVVVKQGDVEAAPDGSPERALLEWWRAFQFHDSAAVIELTSEQALEQVGEKQLTAAVQVLGLPGLAILDSSESGRSAELQVGLLSFSPGPSGKVPRKPTGSSPETFTMRREQDRWLFDDAEYLQLRVNAAGG